MFGVPHDVDADKHVKSGKGITIATCSTARKRGKKRGCEGKEGTCQKGHNKERNEAGESFIHVRMKHSSCRDLRALNHLTGCS